jgi:hypothetical protein
MQHVKILFEHTNSLNNDYGIESAWAIPAGLNYKLDNILFYAPEYSLGDILSVENRNGELYVNGLIEASGHSTIRMIINDPSSVNEIRSELKEMKCESEISDAENLISVDIPKEVNYFLIREFLVKGQLASKWSFEEACIAHTI